MPYQPHVTTRTARNLVPLMGLLVLVAGGCLQRAGSSDAAKPTGTAEPDGPVAQVVVAEAKSIVWPRTVHVQGDLLSDERVVVGEFNCAGLF